MRVKISWATAWRPATLLAAAAVFAAAPAPAQQQPRTLYQRLGGYDALAAVTDDFIGRLIADAELARFFAGHSNDSKQRIRQLIVDQLCAATGGPCVYTGRDMRTSHAGLGITERDWQRTVDHLVATLNRFRVPAAEQRELLEALTRLRPDIVTAM
jgi:hemoglobin